MNWAAGIDLGGTRVKVVAVDDLGAVFDRIATATRDTDAGVEDWIRFIRATLEDLTTRRGAARAVGLCCPGLAAADGRSIAHLPGKLPGLEGIDWSHALGLSHAVPVLNDAHAALLGEAWVGAARGLRHVVLLTLGTGVGGAILADGRLLHKVDFNTLTVVNRQNSKHPLEVYRFLKRFGSRFMQFIPLVERVPPPQNPLGLDLAEPPVADENVVQSTRITPWSLRPEHYGEFLVAIFDEWVRQDVGRVFVQLFDVALGNWSGAGAGLCVFSEKCGSALAIEHNGDVYSCDHYVYPHYKLGNVMIESLGDMVGSARQRKFGADKSDTLPRYCRECEVRFACHGECPKHRFLKTPGGEFGLNYLCAAYKRFFNHVAPYMTVMTRLLHAQQPPAAVMMMVEQIKRETRLARNAL